VNCDITRGKQIVVKDDIALVEKFVTAGGY